MEWMSVRQRCEMDGEVSNGKLFIMLLTIRFDVLSRLLWTTKHFLFGGQSDLPTTNDGFGQMWGPHTARTGIVDQLAQTCTGSMAKASQYHA